MVNLVVSGNGYYVTGSEEGDLQLALQQSQAEFEKSSSSSFSSPSSSSSSSSYSFSSSSSSSSSSVREPISDEQFFSLVKNEMPTDLSALVASFLPEMHEHETQALVSRFYARFGEDSAVEEINQEVAKIEKKYGQNHEIKQINFLDIEKSALNDVQFEFLKTIVKRLFSSVEKIGFQKDVIVELNPQPAVAPPLAPPVVVPVLPPIAHPIRYGRRRDFPFPNPFSNPFPGPFPPRLPAPLPVPPPVPLPDFTRRPCFKILPILPKNM